MGKGGRRRRAKQSQRLLEQAKNRIQKALGPMNFRVRTGLPQPEKISNALSAMLRSEVAEGSPLAEYRAALSVIVIAWNLSLLPIGERDKALDSVIAPFDGKNESIRSEASGQILRLIARKQSLFPDDKRFIVVWDVEIKRSVVHITAAGLAVSP